MECVLDCHDSGYALLSWTAMEKTWCSKGERCVLFLRICDRIFYSIDVVSFDLFSDGASEEQVLNGM